MVELHPQRRAASATARLGRTGRPVVTSGGGKTIDVAPAGLDPGFTPIDLLYSSLASCLAISARIAASELRLLDRLEVVTVQVAGEKAENGPCRIGEIFCELAVEGNLDPAQLAQIAKRAEESAP
ncbi:putative ATP-binding component of ABC transporter [Pseudorhizobium banfieldiae]|uniref:Putative ATP-binding component of ABC transporter n=1 Tax=Pseudorhizobium banfieldiae TaxID=1125847 RepID=L0NEE9_9HYPH|nr:OsmC family protein [Pseudorhizobium banfieldiae]CAD6608284.1 OsmC family peroxiredoxin [arsenite-oxidising bacterium NT-25]CCF19455.1 putative ATP-binding component of ABC transporter [Pseudorhizobium banfieldiae]